jgi:hypothetical protein
LLFTEVSFATDDKLKFVGPLRRLPDEQASRVGVTNSRNV